MVAGDHVDLVRAVQQRYRPGTVLLWGEQDSSPLWEGRTDGAYVCTDQVCGAPALTIEDLDRQLAD